MASTNFSDINIQTFLNSILALSTGKWRENPEKLESFNKTSKIEVGVLSQKDEGSFEARSVINAVMYGAQTSLCMNLWYSFLSWFSIPIKYFTVCTIGSGQGSCQIETWNVGVRHNENVVLTEKVDSSTGHGFPRGKEPDFDEMYEICKNHSKYNPDYVFVYGSLYYMANNKITDNGEFTPSTLQTLPTGNSMISSLPFMTCFPESRVGVIRNIVTQHTGDFKPNWGDSLVFPNHKRNDMYLNLGSGTCYLVEKDTGKGLVSCVVNTDDPKSSAISVNEMLDNYWTQHH
jgi:hypothetical protein